jgi:uncharacterized protein YjcR
MKFYFLNFYFWNIVLKLTNGEMGNSWEQMLLVGAKNICQTQKSNKNMFNNNSFKEPLLNGSATFLGFWESILTTFFLL